MVWMCMTDYVSGSFQDLTCWSTKSLPANSTQGVPRKELHQVLAGKVKVRRMIRRTRPVQPLRGRPCVTKALHTQRPDLCCPRTVPHLLPHARMDLTHRVGLCKLTRVSAPYAPVALRPLAPPDAHVRLGPEAALLRGAPKKGRNDIFDAMDVKHGRGPRGRAAVEGVRPFVQRGAYGRKGRDGRGGVGAAGEEGGEAAAVGLAARVDAGFVYVVGIGDGVDDVVDVGDVVYRGVLVGCTLPDVLHAVLCVVHALPVGGEKGLAGYA